MSGRAPRLIIIHESVFPVEGNSHQGRALGGFGLLRRSHTAVISEIVGRKSISGRTPNWCWAESDVTIQKFVGVLRRWAKMWICGGYSGTPGLCIALGPLFSSWLNFGKADYSFGAMFHDTKPRRVRGIQKSLRRKPGRVFHSQDLVVLT